MPSRALIRLNRRDCDRVLITETLPAETPIIFSGVGVYEWVKGLEFGSAVQKTIVKALVFSGVPGTPDWSVPYLFKIRKNASDFRRLGLVHPRAQWAIRNFYERYHTLIVHYCSVSPATIRAPQRVAGSFYRKNSWQNINEYRVNALTLESLDELTKHCSSFFSYRGCDRLYKFFESRDFFALEKKYKTLWTLDVAKCFDSIYTHSLSWAIKDKDFTKRHRQVGGTFAQEFDRVLRAANHDETNGIVIGPEVSRIFAELIFQKIDLLAIERLKTESGLQFDLEYSFRRYVDDVFIFASNPAVAESVYRCYADVLMQFNLHDNKAKSVRIGRPFVISEKSRLIHDALAEARIFLDKFLGEANSGGSLLPKKIFSVWRLSRSFIDSIKSLCSKNDSSYDDVSSYLISIFCERVKKIAAKAPDVADVELQENYLNALLVLLEVCYFLYGVAPSVTASYKICTAAIVSIRFVRQELPTHFPALAHRIYELTAAHLAEEQAAQATNVKNFVSLEALNVLLASRELGDAYLLPDRIVLALFSESQLGYFDIVCCLFYTRDSALLAGTREIAIKSAKGILGDMSDLLTSSEKAYLLLDLLSCPYIDLDTRRKWLAAAYKTFGAQAPSKVALSKFLASAQTKPWQVDWTTIDLLNLLEKKELKQVY